MSARRRACACSGARFQRAVLLREYFVNVTLKWTFLVLRWYSGKSLIAPKIRGLATASQGGMNCWAQLGHWLTGVTPCPPSLRAGPCRDSGSPCTSPAAWPETWCWALRRAGVINHTHVPFSQGNSYTGKVCCVIHKNKYNEWKCLMLRENRLCP